MDDAYAAHYETPAVDDYLRLRRIAGLTERSAAAAAAGLPNTAVGVVIRKDGQAVGMGRAIGDGLFYQLVDIAVDPAHQQKGLGKTVMAHLMAELDRQAPAEAYVSLIADGQAHLLYRQFGFAPTAPESIGMAQWIKRT
jgi:ribosomal protein S18 acetylase RimI-like enzyme